MKIDSPLNKETFYLSRFISVTWPQQTEANQINYFGRYCESEKEEKKTLPLPNNEVLHLSDLEIVVDTETNYTSKVKKKINK